MYVLQSNTQEHRNSALASSMSPPRAELLHGGNRPTSAGQYAVLAAPVTKGAAHHLPKMAPRTVSPTKRLGHRGRSPSPDDKTLASDHKAAVDYLYSLWDTLQMPPPQRQRTIGGNSMILVTPSWAHVRQLQQAITTLEAELAERDGHESGLGYSGEQGLSPSFYGQSVYNNDSNSSFQYSRPASSSSRRPSRAARHKAAIAANISSDSLTDIGRQLNFSQSNQNTPSVSPVKSAGAGITPEQRFRDRPTVVDAATTTQLSAHEKMQRATDASPSRPSSTNLLDLVKEEALKREDLARLSRGPLDALYLLHMQRVLQFEEDDQARTEAIRAKIENDDEAKEAYLMDELVSKKLLDNGSRPTSASKSPTARISEEHWDQRESVCFEEELRRARLIERGMSLPRVLHGLWSTQVDAEKYVRRLERDEAVARETVMDKIKHVLGTTLDGHFVKLIRRHAYTATYRTEAEERANREFLVQACTDGAWVIDVTTPLTRKEVVERKELQRELDREFSRVFGDFFEARNVARAKQASREKTELSSIERHESIFRTLINQQRGDDWDVIVCQHDEVVERKRLQAEILTACSAMGLMFEEYLARTGVAAEEGMEWMLTVDEPSKRINLEVSSNVEVRKQGAEITETVRGLIMQDEIDARSALLGDEMADAFAIPPQVFAETMERVSTNEARLRDTINEDEDEQRYGVHIQEATSGCATMANVAGMEAIKQVHAAGIVVRFVRACLRRKKQRRARKTQRLADDEDSDLQAQTMAAGILVRAFRRRHAQQEGRRLHMAIVAKREEQERIAREKAAEDEKNRESRALEARVVSNTNILMRGIVDENESRLDVVMAETSDRMDLRMAFREELQSLKENHRERSMLEREERGARMVLESDETEARYPLHRDTDVANGVDASVTGAKIRVSQERQLDAVAAEESASRQMVEDEEEVDRYGVSQHREVAGDVIDVVNAAVTSQ